MKLAAAITLAALILSACEFKAEKLEFSFTPPAQDFTAPVVLPKLK